MSGPITNALPSASFILSFSPPITAFRPTNFHGAVLPTIQQPNSVVPPPKRQNYQPENPHLDVEVIALSPETIMMPPKFTCEVCYRMFPREQNLKLHKRRHNIPCIMKPKSSTETVRRKIYVCPEPTCINHNPSRALGDLTAIKKHYYRKHCEKTFSCEKCYKRYAVKSDCKAHSKICGSKGYKCECGSIFSRKVNYTTHKTSCGVLPSEPVGPAYNNFAANPAHTNPFMQTSQGLMAGGNNFMNNQDGTLSSRDDMEHLLRQLGFNAGMVNYF